MAAPLILVALRLLQGFAVGGEWAGSALLSAEYAPDGKRGRYGMFTLLGGGTAAVLSSLTFLGVNFTIGENSPAFLQWGWRIPFLISAGVIAHRPVRTAQYRRDPGVRRGKGPQPGPQSAAGGGAAAAAPRDRPGRRQHPGRHGFVYMANTYFTRYAHTHLGYSRNFIWAVGALGGLVSIVFVALSATPV